MMSPFESPSAFSWMACPTISSVSFVLAKQVTSRQSRHPVGGIVGGGHRLAP